VLMETMLLIGLDLLPGQEGLPADPRSYAAKPGFDKRHCEGEARTRLSFKARCQRPSFVL